MKQSHINMNQKHKLAPQQAGFPGFSVCYDTLCRLFLISVFFFVAAPCKLASDVKSGAAKLERRTIIALVFIHHVGISVLASIDVRIMEVESLKLRFRYTLVF